jgi:hypothetical protein
MLCKSANYAVTFNMLKFFLQWVDYQSIKLLRAEGGLHALFLPCKRLIIRG